MADFGKEYTSNNAYFIAGGRTLALVKEYEEQKRSSFGPLDAIAADYGGIALQRDESGIKLFAFKKLDSEGLELKEFVDAPSAGTALYVYSPKADTPAGQAIIERVSNVPGPANEVFGKWLTGKQLTETNPDGLSDHENLGRGHYYKGTELASATFERYGDAYVIAVPRVIRGVFNDEAKKLSKGGRFNISAGYTYEWFTPPDSTPIPYSKVVELQEQQLGDQLAPFVGKQKLKTFTPK